jgi:hypothetical protein
MANNLIRKQTIIGAIRLTYVCILILGCSSQLEKEFENRVLGVHKYFSQKPVLLGSNRIIRNNGYSFAYYALIVENFELSSDIKRSLVHSATGYIRVSCEALSNHKSGDLFDDRLKPLESEHMRLMEISGFASSDEAMKNKGFSTKIRFTFLFRYTYREKWVFDGLVFRSEDYDTDAFTVKDIYESHRYRDFRKAIGI